MPEEDYSMDQYIWNNGKSDYFIEENDFDPSKKTRLPKGTDLVVYNKTTKETIGFYFCDPEGNWIKYSNKGE